jgi:nucleoside-diphosphate-sugar epimerase
MKECIPAGEINEYIVPEKNNRKKPEKTRSIILTGATSMIGLALIKECMRHEVKVVALVRGNSPRVNSIPESDLVEIIDCSLENLSDSDKLNNKMSSTDVFFHIGWINNERQYRNSCERQIKNIQYTIDAVNFSSRIGCKRFIGLGGQDEYGIASESLNYKTRIDPITPTGITKYAAGKYAKFECERLGVEYIWVRLLSAYGINDHEDRLIKTFIKNCEANIPMNLSPCTHIWDYLHEDDVGRALFMIGEKGIDGKIYVLGSGIGRPLKEYLEIIRNMVNPDYVPCYGKIPYDEKSLRYLCADISELTVDTGWKSEISFEDGIKSIVRQSDVCMN